MGASGDYPGATAAFHEALVLCPNDDASTAAQLHYNLALAAYNTSCYSEAVSECRHALCLCPTHTNAQELLRRAVRKAPSMNPEEPPGPGPGATVVTASCEPPPGAVVDPQGRTIVLSLSSSDPAALSPKRQDACTEACRPEGDGSTMFGEHNVDNHASQCHQSHNAFHSDVSPDPGLSTRASLSTGLGINPSPQLNRHHPECSPATAAEATPPSTASTEALTTAGARPKVPKPIKKLQASVDHLEMALERLCEEREGVIQSLRQRIERHNKAESEGISGVGAATGHVQSALAAITDMAQHLSSALLVLEGRS